MEDKVLHKEIVVRAPVEQVWQAWTSVDGLRFVSSSSRVELRPGGPYEWFLDHEPDENGRRGGEGARILRFKIHEELHFSWTFPPTIPALRKSGATTEVSLRFSEDPDGSTRLRLDQSGWKSGDEWDAGDIYFDKAWAFVFEKLRESIEGSQ